MTIWIDADACPAAIKEILFKAAERLSIQLTLVANKRMHIPRSRFISLFEVAAGADVADDEIVNKLSAGDLVITADIPLAARVVEKDALALDPRGELYTEDNIRERLSLRDFMDSLRSSGVETGGPAALGKRDKEAFANSLDRILRQHHKAG